MRHRKAGRQLRRTSEQRLALLRNLATSLIEQGAIETTEAKAKELRPFVEKLVGTRCFVQAERLDFDAHEPTPGEVEDFDKLLVAGEPTVTMRATAVPVRLPLPPADKQGSIYENQTTTRTRYFAFDATQEQPAMAE